MLEEVHLEVETHLEEEEVIHPVVVVNLAVAQPEELAEEAALLAEVEELQPLAVARQVLDPHFIHQPLVLAAHPVAHLEVHQAVQVEVQAQLPPNHQPHRRALLLLSPVLVQPAAQSLRPPRLQLRLPSQLPFIQP